MKQFLIISLCVIAITALPSLAYSQRRAPSRPKRPKLNNNPAGQIMRNATTNRPTVSPYLNLLRPQGANSIPNYQSLVRPEMQQNRLNAQQNSALKNLQGEVQGLEGSSNQVYKGVRPTGHHAGFLQHSAYFNTYP